MKGTIASNIGEINIDPEVIARYAGMTAMSCFGIVGMSKVSISKGIARLLKRDSLTKGINVYIEDNEIALDFHLIVAYGVNISAVSRNLCENVRYKVEQFTGLKVNDIKIYIEGVRIID